MKISKLFHWLYGLVMLLPIFAIGVTCLVNTFNDSPNTNTETVVTQEPVYESSNDVESVTDLIIGNYYQYNDNFTYNNDTGSTIILLNFFFVDNSLSSDIDISKQASLYIANGSYNPYISYKRTNNNTAYINASTISFQFRLSSTTENSSLLVGHLSKTYVINSYTDVETITYVQNDIFYYAVDKVQQSSLFNWAYNSFLVTPFAYIVSLFSMPTNSFVVMLLSYWLAISIIWLVFDLIMYLPLLFHRMIDKGVLE